MKHDVIKPTVSVTGLDVPRMEREIAAMRRVLALQAEHAELTQAMASQGLKLSDAARTMAEIAEFVAEKYGISVTTIRGRERPSFYGPARHEAMWLMRQRKWANGRHRWSYPQIGEFFDGRDHTSAIHGVRTHQARIDAGEVQP